MIKKAFLSVTILLLLYEIKLRTGSESMAWGQNQWQNNTIKAQEFLYGEKRDIVITGSSQSAKLDLSELDSSVINIAFRAGNAIDGM